MNGSNSQNDGTVTIQIAKLKASELWEAAPSRGNELCNAKKGKRKKEKKHVLSSLFSLNSFCRNNGDDFLHVINCTPPPFFLAITAINYA